MLSLQWDSLDLFSLSKHLQFLACNLKAVSMEWFRADSFTEVSVELENTGLTAMQILPFIIVMIKLKQRL